MIVCADDYGLREDVDRAIVELASNGKLSAVSCMVALQRCTADALAKLRTHESKIDLGLHLCLTNEDLLFSDSPGSLEAKNPFPSFQALLAQALRRQADQAGLKSRISAQYQLFIEKCGKEPDFIDGHRHVHQFPGVREPLLAFIKDLPDRSRPYVRNTHLPLRNLWNRRLPWLKSGFLEVFGGPMQRKLHAAGVSTNQGFAGIYDFQNWRKYGAYLPGFVACLPAPNGILVVHPGFDEEWRRGEFEALRGFTFGAGMPNRFRR